MNVGSLADPVAPSASSAARRRGREDVAMLVAGRGDGALLHARFRDLLSYLVAGDLLVVNTSATMPAALPARLGERAAVLHLSTPLTQGRWVVELRTLDRLPFGRPPLGARVELPGGAYAELLARYLGSDRLCVARLAMGEPLGAYLSKHGGPIRYAPRSRTADRGVPDGVCK